MNQRSHFLFKLRPPPYSKHGLNLKEKKLQLFLSKFTKICIVEKNSVINDYNILMSYKYRLHCPKSLSSFRKMCVSVADFRNTVYCNIFCNILRKTVTLTHILRKLKKKKNWESEECRVE
jgi:hypothetical protein